VAASGTLSGLLVVMYRSRHLTVGGRNDVMLRGASLAGLVLLAACTSLSEQPLADDKIKDEATAIRLGQEGCLAPWAVALSRKESGWKAVLHNRVWHVWLEGKACESFGSNWDAATGKKIGDCSICVT